MKPGMQAGRSRARRCCRLAASLGVVLVALGGCTGDGEGRPATSETSVTSGAAAGGDSVAVDRLVSDLAAPVPAPVAGADGTIEEISNPRPVPARADVIEVRGTSAGTVLHWRLSAPGGDVRMNNRLWSRGRSPGSTSEVRLVARSADLQLSPATWHPESEVSSDCSCSKAPYLVGPVGVEMSALYPALPPEVTEVEVQMPGFDPITVPVTR